MQTCRRSNRPCATFSSNSRYTTRSRGAAAWGAAGLTRWVVGDRSLPGTTTAHCTPRRPSLRRRSGGSSSCSRRWRCRVWCDPRTGPTSTWATEGRLLYCTPRRYLLHVSGTYNRPPLPRTVAQQRRPSNDASPRSCMLKVLYQAHQGPRECARRHTQTDRPTDTYVQAVAAAGRAA
jgi:hypothetical protein